MIFVFLEYIFVDKSVVMFCFILVWVGFGFIYKDCGCCNVVDCFCCYVVMLYKWFFLIDVFFCLFYCV